MDPDPLLEIRHLTTSFQTETGRYRAVEDVNLAVPRGKTVALVGESGCGKSVTALSVMRLLPETTSFIDRGEIFLDGIEILELSKSEMRNIRGNRVSMIFQEPMTALNPVFTVGNQISEVFRIHRGCSRSEGRALAIAMLAKVGIPDPDRRVDEYPFQLSGGMRQRIMIAMALACEPQLLIADEPTTALDVTIQAQILDLMLELQRENGTSILLITHDLGVVAETADEVAIMYAGGIVERGTAKQLFDDPQHPYTQGLMASLLRLDTQKDRPLAVIEGTVPSLQKMPMGCRFHPRCPHTEERCRAQPPALEEGEAGRGVACYWVAGAHSR